MLRAGVAIALMMIACTVAASYGSSGSLSVMVYQDGLAHVSAQFDVDPLDPVFELGLLGLEVDNFVATDGDRALLSVEFLEGVAILETFDSETVVAEYDVHDLVSKEGRIWTFALDAAQDYALIMPRNAVIIGMNTIPMSLEVVDERTVLEIPGGPAEIDYILSPARTTVPVDGGGGVGEVDAPEDGDDSITSAVLIGIPAAVILAGTLLAIRLRSRRPGASPRIAAMAPVRGQTPAQAFTEQPAAKLPSPEEIFALMPDIREADREIVRHIHESGGEMLESNLRKKLLQPRTTMWRAIKRLERMGVVEVTKRDTQNLVRIRPNPGELP